MSWGVSNRRSEWRLRAKTGNNKGSHPVLVVLSGPSGVGKDAVLSRMKELGRPFYYVVTATTRPKRTEERDGADYHFLSQKEFQQLIDKQRFLEWAVVYGNYYGVPRDEISSPLSKGLDTIVKVDVQGAATIKKVLPQAVFIFLMPPSLEALRKRLRRRRSESPRDLAIRLEMVKEEARSLRLFDYVIISRQNKLDQVVSEIDAIISAEKCRVKPRIVRP